VVSLALKVVLILMTQTNRGSDPKDEKETHGESKMEFGVGPRNCENSLNEITIKPNQKHCLCMHVLFVYAKKH